MSRYADQHDPKTPNLTRSPQHSPLKPSSRTRPGRRAVGYHLGNAQHQRNSRMDLHLSGKIAVVTGAGKGIGLAVTRALSDEGVRVVAGARNIVYDVSSVG